MVVSGGKVALDRSVGRQQPAVHPRLCLVRMADVGVVGWQAWLPVLLAAPADRVVHDLIPMMQRCASARLRPCTNKSREGTSLSGRTLTSQGMLPHSAAAAWTLPSSTIAITAAMTVFPWSETSCLLWLTAVQVNHPWLCAEAARSSACSSARTLRSYCSIESCRLCGEKQPAPQPPGEHSSHNLQNVQRQSGVILHVSYS